jgi:hypothetical protein
LALNALAALRLQEAFEAGGLEAEAKDLGAFDGD